MSAEGSESFENFLIIDHELRTSEASVRLDALSKGLWVAGGDGLELDAALGLRLSVPERSQMQPKVAVPMDYVSVYITLEDYVGEDQMPDSGARAVADEILARRNPSVLLLGLSVLNHLSRGLKENRGLADEFREALRPDLRAAFDEWFSEGEREDEPKTMLLSRQGILAAMKGVLLAHPNLKSEGARNLEAPSVLEAILLVHAVSCRFKRDELEEYSTEGSEKIGAVYPVGLTMELVRNGLFYVQDSDEWRLARTLDYWQIFARKKTRVSLRAAPRALLSEALGMEFEDFFALALWLWLNAINRDPRTGDRFLLQADFPGVGLPPKTIRRFVELVSAEPHEIAEKLEEGTDTSFDFLPFQSRPVLRLENKLLVLDEDFLLEKFTSGIFWAVHDHEKFEREDEAGRSRWNEAHGEVIEMMAQERLERISPVLFERDGSRRKTYFSEEDLKTTYSKSKIADAAVDYETEFLAVEVVGGQPVVGTRVQGNPKSFEADTRKLIVHEAEQLDGICSSLIEDQKRLTGYEPLPGREIVPAIVVGGGYPSDAISRTYVDELLANKGLLQQKEVAPLCILNLAELELLEGLREAGEKPARLLIDWRRSSLHAVSFWNYVLRVKPERRFRPSRIRIRTQNASREFARRLTGPWI
ncbi:MAG: hypothetical protein ACR2KW_07200 [Rubrobacter sp.]